MQAVTDSRHIHKDVFQVEVFCRQSGDTEIVYRVGNIASASNMYPVQASIQIEVHRTQDFNFLDVVSERNHL